MTQISCSCSLTDAYGLKHIFFPENQRLSFLAQIEQRNCVQEATSASNLFGVPVSPPDMLGCFQWEELDCSMMKETPMILRAVRDPRKRTLHQSDTPSLQRHPMLQVNAESA